MITNAACDSRVSASPESAFRRTTKTQRGARSSAARSPILATYSATEVKCGFIRSQTTRRPSC